MTEIRNTLIAIVVFFLLARLLLCIRAYKVALIKRAVIRAEKQFAAAEKSGQLKKAAALRFLRFFLIQADDFTNQLIDVIVAVANEKHTEMTDALRAVTTTEVKEKLEQLNGKKSAEDEDEDEDGNDR
jgi:hypothetical protein